MAGLGRFLSKHLPDVSVCFVVLRAREQTSGFGPHLVTADRVAL